MGQNPTGYLALKTEVAGCYGCCPLIPMVTNDSSRIELKLHLLFRQTAESYQPLSNYIMRMQTAACMVVMMMMMTTTTTKKKKKKKKMKAGTLILLEHLVARLDWIFSDFSDGRNEETANIFCSDTLQGSHWILPERSTQTAGGPSVRIKAQREAGHNLSTKFTRTFHRGIIVRIFRV